VLSYRHGKTNWLTLRETICDWWNHPRRRRVVLSALPGRSFSHGQQSVIHAEHMVICWVWSAGPLL
jgi:hypothetical protein